MDDRKTYAHIDEMFNQLIAVTGIEDIGLHRVDEHRLSPIYKTGIGKLSLDYWKAMHDKKPVLIKENPILLHVIEGKSTVVISDVGRDDRTTQDVFLFGIESLMIIPVEDEGIVKAIVPIVSIIAYHEFTEEERIKSEKLVEAYKEQILSVL